MQPPRARRAGRTRPLLYGGKRRKRKSKGGLYARPRRDLQFPRQGSGRGAPFRFNEQLGAEGALGRRLPPPSRAIAICPARVAERAFCFEWEIDAKGKRRRGLLAPLRSALPPLGERERRVFSDSTRKATRRGSEDEVFILALCDSQSPWRGSGKAALPAAEFRANSVRPRRSTSAA